jgi:NCAIR mutase (PurE)-related protein
VNREQITDLLHQVKRGKVSVRKALHRLKHFPSQDLGFAVIDHHRTLRQGQSEVIYCEGKRPNEIRAIARRLLVAGNDLLATRATPTVFQAIRRLDRRAQYNEWARTVVVRQNKTPQVVAAGPILILTAGTSDIPVAEEARVTIQFLGSPVETLYDVGVAGVHRLLSHRNRLDRARVLVVAAGMDGALVSIVGGLVDKPVIAVPTSVGYGASFGGISALLAMLNSCAAGVAVVNIDNGFGAGVLAHRINTLM